MAVLAASNVQIFTLFFGFVFEDNSVREITSQDYRDTIVFEKLCFQNVFRTPGKETLAFLNFSGLKSVFEKLRFPDGLMWTVGPTLEINCWVFKFFRRRVNAA